MMLSISKLLKKTGHQIYFNIFPVLSASVFWSLFLVPAIFVLPRHFAVLFLLVTFVPATTAVYAAMHQVTETHRVKVKDFFRHFFHFFSRSFLIGLLFSLAIVIPVSQWWYYLSVNPHFMMLVFALFQTYFCLTFLCTQVYTIPYLVIEDGKAIQSMNLSIKKFMSHTWYTMGLFTQILSITVLLSLTIIGFFLLYIGMLSIFVLNATKNLSLEENETEEKQEEVEA